MRGRQGVALVAVLLLLLAATALAHGALLLARAEWAGAGDRARAAVADAAIAGRLDAAVRTPFPGALSEVQVFAHRVLESEPGTEGFVRVRRLGAESWWLEHLADTLGPRRTGVPGRLVWWMDPLTRIESWGAVLSVGPDAPWTLAGTVDRTDFAQVPVGLDGSGCGFGARAPDGLPDPVGVLTAVDVPPGLGLLTFDTLMARTAVSLSGVGTPAPQDDLGVCAEDDAWNWGDPERPGSPCGEMVGVRAAASGLRMDGGVGQAAIVVDGDLELSGDARLYGFVIASGSLRVLDRAELHGVAVAAGGVLVETGARVEGSACWAGRALLAARAQWMPRPTLLAGLSLLGP